MEGGERRLAVNVALRASVRLEFIERAAASGLSQGRYLEGILLGYWDKSCVSAAEVVKSVSGGGVGCEGCGDLRCWLGEARAGLEFYAGEGVWGGTGGGPLMVDRRDWRAGERGECLGGGVAAKVLMGLAAEGGGGERGAVVEAVKRPLVEEGVAAGSRRAAALAALAGVTSASQRGFAGYHEVSDLANQPVRAVPKPVSKKKGR